MNITSAIEFTLNYLLGIFGISIKEITFLILVVILIVICIFLVIRHIYKNSEYPKIKKDD